MKKFLSCTKTAILLLIITVLSIGAYAYMIARPISYSMGYHTEYEYEGIPFEGTMKFYPDGTVFNVNSNFEDGRTFRYYYKDGYVFSTIAETDEEYEEEVAYINENFEEAVNAPFYATKINAFKQVSVGVDGFTTVYICKPAIILAVVWGIIDLALIALSVVSLFICKKSKI